VIGLASSGFGDGSKKRQKAIDAKITDGLEKWIKDGGLTVPGTTLDDLSTIIDADKAQLQYYFRTVMGKRFSVWRKELRIRIAQELILDNPDMSISHIGAKVGFRDKSNFKKRFKEVTGCLPMEWKASVSGEK